MSNLKQNNCRIQIELKSNCKRSAPENDSERRPFDKIKQEQETYSLKKGCIATEPPGYRISNETTSGASYRTAIDNFMKPPIICEKPGDGQSLVLPEKNLTRRTSLYRNSTPYTIPQSSTFTRPLPRPDCSNSTYPPSSWQNSTAVKPMFMPAQRPPVPKGAIEKSNRDFNRIGNNGQVLTKRNLVPWERERIANENLRLDDRAVRQKAISYFGFPTNLVHQPRRYHPVEGDVDEGHPNSTNHQYLSNLLTTPSTVKVTRGTDSNISNIPQMTVENPSHICIVPKKSNLTEKVIEMLVIDMQPVSVLEGSGFKKLISTLEPTYCMPSVKDFLTDHIPKRYYVEKKKVQNMLKESENIHISIELWTGYGDQSFLTVSGHFVTNDFQYKNYALNTFCLNEVNPEHLMTNVVTSISEWDLSRDVMCIVNDGSDVVTKASELTGWSNITCFAYILDDIIKSSIAASGELDALIAKCRNVVNFLRSNESAKQLLEAQMHDEIRKMQHLGNHGLDRNVALDVKNCLKVKKDNYNEWISTFYMLKRIATLKNVLTNILNKFANSIDILTEKDWTAIDEFISLFKAFKFLIVDLCKEPYQFASKIIPITSRLNSLINDCNSLTLGCVEIARKNIQSALQKLLGQVEHNPMLAIATVLDPRFKNTAFQSETAYDAAIRQLTNETSKQVTMMDTSGHERDVKDDSFWEELDKKVVISNEIKKYLEEPMIDKKDNPFLWWKTQGQAQFPILARMARRILCIPATSIPPERVFFKKGLTFSERRRFIKPKYVDQFVFLNMNID